MIYLNYKLDYSFPTLTLPTPPPSPHSPTHPLHSSYTPLYTLLVCSTCPLLLTTHPVHFSSPLLSPLGLLILHPTPLPHSLSPLPIPTPHPHSSSSPPSPSQSSPHSPSPLPFLSPLSSSILTTLASCLPALSAAPPANPPSPLSFSAGNPIYLPHSLSSSPSLPPSLPSPLGVSKNDQVSKSYDLCIFFHGFDLSDSKYVGLNHLRPFQDQCHVYFEPIRTMVNSNIRISFVKQVKF